MVVLALLAVGCSADDGTSWGRRLGQPVALLDRLTPGETTRAVVVDLRAAREKLGVGAVDPRTGSFEDPARRHYADLYAAAFPLTGEPRQLPVLDAVDLGRVSAVASNGYLGEEAVAVLATDQPFDEVAAALVAAGYTRDGSLVREEDPARTEFAGAASVVAGGEGVIAVGRSVDIVRAAAEGTAPGIRGVVRSLVDELSAPAAAAYEYGMDCPRALAVADDVDEDRGRLVVVADSPDAERLTADDPDAASFADMRFERPSVDADRVTVAMDYSSDTGAISPLVRILELVIGDVYDCG
ncbi:hypothetical protein BU204_02820 [Actinophytocola xanthii]|uniref:Uncharacterized protein n=1 Tax=Actinophytocola xanthii TaxID=1912961 RepID=A0A1Q8CY58_9PSEU|nr:hypothetical protein BU204_02820 [Actinophytocola xanthii]